MAKKLDVKGILEKSFGKGSVFGLEDDGVDKNTQWIPTGFYSLDYVFGAGIPKGKVIEILGREGSGKTTLSLFMIRILQRLKPVLFIDAEHALDPQYAKYLGVSLSKDKFLLSQPDDGEMAFDMISKALELDLGGIIVDSAAALVPKAEMDGSMGDSQMAAFPKLMAKGLRKISPKAADAGIPVIFTNQVRKVFGVKFGVQYDSPGGLAFRHWANIRLMINKIKTLMVGEEAVANLVKIKAIKNKVAPPFRTAQFELNFKYGLDTIKDTLNVALEKKIIKVKESKRHEGKQIVVYDGHNLGFYDNELRKINRDKVNIYLDEINNKINGKVADDGDTFV